MPKREPITWLEYYIAKEKIKKLEEENRILREENEKLREKMRGKIEELERKLAKYDNENTPPSLLKKMAKQRFKGKPGRKPGHEGVSRASPEPDITIDWELENCPDCGHPLPKAHRTYTRTAEEIIPARATIIEYVVHESWCSKCKKVVKRNVPAKGRFGYHAHAVASYLRYKQRMPIEGVSETLNELCGLEVTPATVVGMTERTATEFEPMYDEIVEEVRSSEAANGDETGWRINGKNWWNWVFATQEAAFYHIDKSRGRQVANKLMKGFDGVLITDAWNAYSDFDERQQCWAHILRRSKRLVDNKHHGAKVLHDGLKLLYYDALDGTSDYDELLNRLDRLCSPRQASKKARKLMKWLRSHKEELFRFVVNPVVPPNNNHAERLMRPVVVARKITGGHRSEDGARAFAVMASVMATWKLKGKDYFSEARKYLSRRQASGG